MKSYIACCAFVASIFAPAVGFAQGGNESGLYVRAAIGVDFVHSFKHDLVIDPSASSPYPAGYAPEQSLDLDSSYAPAFAVGYDFAGPLRVDAEYRRFDNKIGSVSRDGTELDWLTGDLGSIKANAVLANVVYDFANVRGLRPFIGVGAGAVHYDKSGSAPVLPGPSDWTLAYQAKAGAAYPLPSGISVGAEYAYFGSSGSDFDATESGLVSEGQGVSSSIISVFIQKTF